ncbi:phage tail protein [Microcoleus sp. F4-D5]|uniref:phage tail protein n=1 Tax=Microcoleus sp. F4-D5 TaxID=2818760 RepID=UPI002FD175EC
MFNLPIPPLPLPRMGLTTPVALPVGTVVAFAGKIASFASDPPSEYTTNIEALGWLLCDGTLREKSKYPELFAVLGYLYGGEGGKFKLPDYQGQFLRGVDGGTNNDDPDASSRKHPDRSNNKDNNNGVGSRQEDALQIHQHSYQLVNEITGRLGENKAAMLVEKATTFTALPLDSEARTSKETRPKNVYVYYIIKYTYG